MRQEATRQLDRIDRLRVGQGMLEAFAFGRGDFVNGIAGGALDYSHRLSTSLSAFGRGEVGYNWGERQGLSWEAMAGVRGRW